MNVYVYVGNDPVNGVDPTGLYVDLNGGFGLFGLGFTGGFIFTESGVHSYGGIGVMTPGPSLALTWSHLNPSPGANFGIQAAFFGAVQGGTDGAGNPFYEVGIGTPGLSFSWYGVSRELLGWARVLAVFGLRTQEE